MRLCLLSDVHSNLPALEAVLASLSERNPHEVLCLGDTVGYNAYPNECLDMLEERSAKLIMGNHDWAATVGDARGFNPIATAGVAYTRKVLSPHHHARLSKLPFTQTIQLGGKTVAAFHGSPRNPLMEYLFPDAPEAAWAQMAELAGRPDVVATGHTHLPMTRTAAQTMFVNPGSVGQPRDGDPRASYGVLDTDPFSFRVVRVAYDIDRIAAANKKAGLPDQSWQRLYRGT